MSDLRTYILRVICTAMICVIVQIISEYTPQMQNTVRFITGVVMLVVVLQPLTCKQEIDFGLAIQNITGECTANVVAGKEWSSNSVKEFIKEETEAYILEKASHSGIDISVEVELSEDEVPVPIAAVISGSVSPYNKKYISECLVNDLNIPEENQQWN